MCKRVELFAATIVVAGLLLLAGCNKKVARVVPPAPPAAAAPTATLAANPSVIEQGQSTELSWHTTSANSVNIAGLGEVGASGSQTVTPNSSTTYTLTATGAGGTQDATTRVTVNPVAKTTSAASLSDRDLFNQLVKDVYFDFNNASLRSEETSTAQGDGSFLAQHPDLRIVIEGHCDDRGSEVYNLALGDSRANSLKTTLIAQGVSADRIKTISYGKEHPFCSEDNETCWQQNRRDHVSLQP
ncbi:MAG TPA: OmpA family protein [Terriglobales bacterium]|nr:OmpA family protein [Terriglobales bacterium]